MSFVLDASVALSWVFERDTRAERLRSERVLARLAREAAIVPDLFYREVLNGLLVGERRKLIASALTAEFLAKLGDLPLEDDSILPRARQDAILGLARQYGLSAYDATYLDLAMRSRSSLATFDGPLGKAADAVGVDVL